MSDITITHAPSKRAAKAKAAPTPGPLAAATDPLDEAVLKHGLTEVAAKVYDPNEPDVETVASRMEAAGQQVDAAALSSACKRLAKAGRAEKVVTGYRLKRGVE